MKWQTEKPNEPCIFVARSKTNIKDTDYYSTYYLEYIDNPEVEDTEYLGLHDWQGNEDDYNDLEADEYLIIQKTRK